MNFQISFPQSWKLHYLLAKYTLCCWKNISQLDQFCLKLFFFLFVINFKIKEVYFFWLQLCLFNIRDLIYIHYFQKSIHGWMSIWQYSQFRCGMQSNSWSSPILPLTVWRNKLDYASPVSAKFMFLILPCSAYMQGEQPLIHISYCFTFM